MAFSRRAFLAVSAGSALALSAGGARAAAFRLRGIFETPLEEPFVTQLHLAMQRLQSELGLDYARSENVKAADFSRVLRQWCDDGVEMIVGDAYGTEDICRRVAHDYPKTAFVMGSAAGPKAPNFSTFYGVNYEAAYLAGMLAGALTKTKTIGAVSGVTAPSTYALLNAFRQGAREVVPDLSFKAAYIGSFFDPPKAKEAAIAMAEQLADVIFAERIGVIEAAAEKHIVAIGNMTDQASINPDVVATSVIWDPYPVLKAAVAAVTSGKFAEKDYSVLETVATGANYLAPLGRFQDKVSAEVKAAIEKKRQDIASGAFKVPYDESETKSN